MPNDFFATCERDEHGWCTSSGEGIVRISKQDAGKLAAYYKALGEPVPTHELGYLYHGTTLDRLKSIEDRGLVSGAPGNFPGYSGGADISLTKTVDDVIYWSSAAMWRDYDARGDGTVRKPVILRTKETGAEREYRRDEVRATSVDKSNLEVWKDGEWRELTKQSLTANVRNARVPARKLDPTRTGQLRRNFARQIKRKFRRLKGDLLKWLVVDDSLGMRSVAVRNTNESFLATCERDEHGWCSPSGTGGELSIESAKSMQEKLSKRYESSPQFRDAAYMLKEQTTTDAKADVVQSVIRAVAADRDPHTDPSVQAAVARFHTDAATIDRYAAATPGYLETVRSAPESKVPLYRGFKGAAPKGDTVEFTAPTSVSDSVDVAAHYAGKQLYEIEPGARALPVALTISAQEGPEGGVFKHRQTREPYRDSQKVYFGATMESDDESMVIGKYKVIGRETRKISYRDQITDKLKTKEFNVVKLRQIKEQAVNMLVDDSLGMRRMAVNQEKVKYGHVGLSVGDETIHRFVAQIREYIEPADVIEFEDNLHITARYGFLAETDPDEVTAIVKDFGSIQISFGKLSLFRNPDADVLKIDVISPQLTELHDRLAALPHVDTHAEFNPHMTIAYLNPGSGDKYVGVSGLEFARFKITNVVYSTADRIKTEITTNAPVTSFKFATNTQKLAEFKRWLREKFKGQLTGKTDAELWERFIKDGFMRGAGRAFDDSRAAEKAAGFQSPDSFDGGRQEFLRSSFGRPETREKVELLASRSFEDLVNVTETMATRMGRVLADGLVRGANPREVARELDDELDIGYRRAETIARTEIIRAHAEGQLDAFDRMGVEEIGVMVEWKTAGDDRVCEQCSSMEGVVLRVEEAHGMIPAHPNCRCAFLPANLGEDREDQIRGKKAIDEAMGDAGLEADISRYRPSSLLNAFSAALNYDPNQLRDEHGRWTDSGVGANANGLAAVQAHMKLAKKLKDADRPLHPAATKGQIQVNKEEVAKLKKQLAKADKQLKALGIDKQKYGETQEVLKLPVTVFHGTTSEALASIKEHGLVPRFLGDNFGSNEVNIGDRAASVYISKSSFDALGYGENAAEKHGGKAVVLKIQIPKSHLPLVTTDEGQADGYKLKGTIPPEWITNLDSIKTNEGYETLYLVFIVQPETLNVFCPTGEGGGVDPSCSPGGNAAGVISKMSRNGLTDAQLEQHKATLKEALKNATPGMLERIEANVSKVVPYASVDAVTKACDAVESVPPNMTVGGFYHNGEGSLHIDGDYGPEARITGPRVASEIAAHEFSHAIDGVGDTFISDDPAWQSAWKREIAHPSAPLSKYARTSYIEGFAELGRALMTKDRAAVEREFPECVEFWRSKGLL